MSQHLLDSLIELLALGPQVPCVLWFIQTCHLSLVFHWLWAISKVLSFMRVSPCHLRSPGCLIATQSTLRMMVDFTEVSVGPAPGSFGQGCRGLLNEAGKLKSH